jgi:hypothetical protein
MDQYLREPSGAAVIAGAVTMAYVYGRAKMNNEGPIKNSEMMKPAFLVALLVYFIVSRSSESHETMTREPF